MPKFFVKRILSSAVTIEVEAEDAELALWNAKKEEKKFPVVDAAGISEQFLIVPPPGTGQTPPGGIIADGRGVTVPVGMLRRPPSNSSAPRDEPPLVMAPEGPSDRPPSMPLRR